MGESDLDSMYTNCPIKIGLCILEVGKQRNPEADSACDADMVVEGARGKRGGRRNRLSIYNLSQTIF